MGKTRMITLIIAVVILILLLVFWRYIFILPLWFHQKVNIPSGIYLPSPSVVQSSEIKYDPLHPPLDTDISSIRVDHSKGEVIFNFQTGEQLTVQFGEASRVTGCEHQFSMEYFLLHVQELQLGSVLVHNPILMVSCDMRAMGE